MTAFLFIPATVGSGTARHIDFAKVAGMLAEAEEPARGTGPRRTLLRTAAAALLVLLAIGDTLLVARPGRLACETAPRADQVKAVF